MMDGDETGKAVQIFCDGGHNCLHVHRENLCQRKAKRENARKAPRIDKTDVKPLPFVPDRPHFIVQKAKERINPHTGEVTLIGKTVVRPV